MPSPSEIRRVQALQALLSERGGALPALGYRPPILIPGGGTSGGPSGGRSLVRQFGEGPVVVPLGQLPASESLPSLNVGAAFVPPFLAREIALAERAGLLGLSAGAAALGKVGGPEGEAIGAIVGALLPSLVQSGRPKKVATLEAAKHLIESGQPALIALGRGIAALAARGVVASSPEFGRALMPLLRQTVSALSQQGYNPADARKAIFSVFQRGAPAAAIPPALPPAPRPAGLRPGYRVIDVAQVAPEVGRVAPAAAAGVSSPYGGGAGEAGAAAAASIPTVAAATMVPASALPGWLSTAVKYLGLEQAGLAAVRLLRGENLSLPEFGALAGTIVGAYAGDPQFGAEVGLGAGEAVQQLDSIARDYIGHGLDELLGQGARATLARLRASVVSQPQPQPQPETRQIASQPQPQPQPETRQIVSQPEPQPLAKPCPNCPPPGPQDCPPEVQLLLSQIENCPPEILRQIGDKILNNYSVVQRPGHQPEIVPKTPVCLCCESAADFNAYVESNGVQGKCQQVIGADASIVGRK